MCCSYSMGSFEMTEFLVNYSAGYVRRGLFGELLLAFTSHTHIDPKWVIYPICAVSYLSIVALICYLCKKRGCCLWIMLWTLFAPCACFGIMRKDYIIYLLVAAMIYCMFRVRGKGIWREGCAFLLYLLAMQLHECTFFMIAPFLLWYYVSEEGVLHFTWKKVCAILFIIIPMLLVSAFKGTEQHAQTIFNSWTPYIGSQLSPYPTGTIESIGWSTGYAINKHIEMNFLTDFMGIIYGWMVMPALILVLVYMIPNLLLPSWSKVTDLHEKRSVFTAVLLFQMVALIPMFTVLSCDHTRIFTYWILTSFFIYAFVPHHVLHGMIPNVYQKMVTKLNAIIFSKHSTIISAVLMFFVGLPFGSYINFPVKTPIFCYFKAAKELFCSLI